MIFLGVDRAIKVVSSRCWDKFCCILAKGLVAVSKRSGSFSDAARDTVEGVTTACLYSYSALFVETKR